MATEYSSETRAAVMAALLTGQSIPAIAREYNVPRGTVYGWKRQVFSVVPDDAASDATQKGEIGDLLLGYLTSALKTLKIQVEFFSDKQWLAKQDASEVAVLHGVLADKTVRLLEALSTSNDS
jgi:transposase-like protein